MSILLNKVFTQLQPSHTEVLTQLSNLELNHYFLIKGPHDQQVEVMLAISQNYLLVSQVFSFSTEIFEGQELNFFTSIDFDLKFEVFRKEWEDEKTPGVPFGIKLERESLNDEIYFFNNDPLIVQQWIQVLSKRINQRNFHKLFKAKKKIGKGAFATVYLAERLMDKRMFAVKAFSKEKQYSGEKGKESLENEIKVMRNIDHPNIAKLEEVYETDNSIYVILEYLEGRMLNEEIKSGKIYSEEECKFMIKQILSALNHLSERRIIHRDLKPENIMFKKEASLELSICDFGLATHADEQNYLFVRCGTPGFVAPEIINIKDMTTKSEPISDVFSAGIIFHHLLLGKSIFPGKKYNDVLAQNRICDFNFESEEYISLPPTSLSLLKSMLERNPKKRITSKDALTSIYFNNLEKQQKQFKPLKKDKENHTMDIEQPNYLNRPVLFEINQNISSTYNGSVMIDENEKNEKRNPFESLNKRQTFMNNNSGYAYGTINKRE